MSDCYLTYETHYIQLSICLSNLEIISNIYEYITTYKKACENAKKLLFCPCPETFLSIVPRIKVSDSLLKIHVIKTRIPTLKYENLRLLLLKINIRISKLQLKKFYN
jgi:hypothetical protein